MLPPSLKAIGRRRTYFHLDDLVHFGQDPEDDTFFWICLMAEADVREQPLGHIVGGLCVSCGMNGRSIESLEDAQEQALAHLVNFHRAHGGRRLPKERGRERRAREIKAWSDRRRAEAAEGKWPRAIHTQ